MSNITSEQKTELDEKLVAAKEVAKTEGTVRVYLNKEERAYLIEKLDAALEKSKQRVAEIDKELEEQAKKIGEKGMVN